MPDRVVSEAILRAQGSVPDDHVLVADHNDQHDPIIPPGTSVDLAGCTVFYSIPRCDAGNPRPQCLASPKIVISVDDRLEVVIKPEQTGDAIFYLFNLQGDVDLIRDSESPEDQIIAKSDLVDLRLGNVFVTRRSHGLRIIVNKQSFTTNEGVLHEMTGAQIAALVFPGNAAVTVKKISGSDKIEIPLDKLIKIQNCDEFRVIRKDVNAGFLPYRLERELGILREGGAKISVVESPHPAVIFHDVPSTLGGVETTTDVLVIIPPSYPAGIPDNAFLPLGSPLLQTAPGSAQEIQSLGGREWQKKSIHPYTNNSRIPWNQNSHGFHTYFGELLCWLNA